MRTPLKRIARYMREAPLWQLIVPQLGLVFLSAAMSRDKTYSAPISAGFATVSILLLAWILTVVYVRDKADRQRQDNRPPASEPHR